MYGLHRVDFCFDMSFRQTRTLKFNTKFHWNIVFHQIFWKTECHIIYRKNEVWKTEFHRIYEKNEFWKTEFHRIYGKNEFWKTEFHRIYGKNEVWKTECGIHLSSEIR